MKKQLFLFRRREMSDHVDEIKHFSLSSEVKQEKKNTLHTNDSFLPLISPAKTSPAIRPDSLSISNHPSTTSEIEILAVSCTLKKDISDMYKRKAPPSCWMGRRGAVS